MRNCYYGTKVNAIANGFPEFIPFKDIAEPTDKYLIIGPPSGPLAALLIADTDPDKPTLKGVTVDPGFQDVGQALSGLFTHLTRRTELAGKSVTVPHEVVKDYVQHLAMIPECKVETVTWLWQPTEGETVEVDPKLFASITDETGYVQGKDDNGISELPYTEATGVVAIHYTDGVILSPHVTNGVALEMLHHFQARGEDVVIVTKYAITPLTAVFEAAGFKPSPVNFSVKC